MAWKRGLFALIGFAAISAGVLWSRISTVAPDLLRSTGNAARLERIASSLPGADDDSRLRIQTLLTRGAAGDEASVAPLCEALVGESNVAIRVAAAAALGRLGRAAGIDCLKRAQSKERASGVVAQIDRSLAILEDVDAKTLDDQRSALFRRMAAEMDLSDSEMAEVRRIVLASDRTSQGNPTASVHPMTRAKCREVRAEAGLRDIGNSECGAKYMVALVDPASGKTRANATACIDQYEFPDIPCEYPVVYARANEAADLCKAVGKRICDAHEWEGACAGTIRSLEVEYAWGIERPLATYYHNTERPILWSYGPKRDDSKCATSSGKSPDCFDGGWRRCGTNTWPAGAFPTCVSPIGVYDLNGNAAEHMNLPMSVEELASRGGTGSTEMKGSWFATAGLDLEDDCRWRAKDWHPSKLMDDNSHRNYHLGFRCCKDVVAEP